MRAIYLTNAVEAARVQDLIDGDIFPLDVAGLPTSCNRTATITMKRTNSVARVRARYRFYIMLQYPGERDRDVIITMQHSNRSTFVC